MKVLLKNLALQSGLRVAGPVFFMGMQVSSLNTAKTILINKTVGSLSPLPFMSLFVNCVVWSFYGYLRGDLTVLIPNLSGALVGLLCSSVYQYFCSETPANLYLITTSLILASSVLFAGRNFKFLGYLGCSLAIILMGSPLATLKTVISEKSTASLPFWTSVSTWLNALSWSLYGIFVAGDGMVISTFLLL